MGASDPWAQPNEVPVHTVTVSNFSIGQTEVTQAQWLAVMGVNPSAHYSCGFSCPVETVSWTDVQAYLSALSAKTGHNYRLPTEAEWEYAVRAGTSAAYFIGADATWLFQYAWYANNSAANTHSVGKLYPNPFGLYDMDGNVWEWLQDCWNTNYVGAPTDGTAWMSGECTVHMIRGGAFDTSEFYLRSPSRSAVYYTSKGNDLGFRVVREP